MLGYCRHCDSEEQHAQKPYLKREIFLFCHFIRPATGQTRVAMTRLIRAIHDLSPTMCQPKLGNVLPAGDVQVAMDK
jgi:hypothetical protein